MMRNSRLKGPVPFTLMFYLAAGLVLALTAAVFSYGGIRYVTNQALDQGVRLAAEQVLDLKEKYKNGLTRAEWESLLPHWRQNHFIATKLWKPDGTIIFASNRKLEGQKFPVERAVKAAASGKTFYHLSNLDGRENRFERKHGELLEIYLPVKIGRRVVAVHELYLSTGPLRREISRVSQLIWLANAAAFGLLFLVLSGIVRRAARKMEAQRSSLSQALGDLSRHFLATIESLNKALQSRDNYTARHSERVAVFAVAIGKALKLSDVNLNALRIGSLFHDIGKIGIPDDVLLKQAPLEVPEYDKIMEHPAIGHRILAPLPSMAPGLAVVRHHHESWDGSGYPDGLKGEAIELVARIAAYADAFDALTSNRPYRLGMTPEHALEAMAEMVGERLDPGLAPVALKVLAKAHGIEFRQSTLEPILAESAP